MRLFLILILYFTTSAALAQRELTAITVNFASGEQLVSVIKPYLSEGSSVSLFQNQLILNVTPQELSKTRELLQQLDKAGRQLLVSVRTDSTGSTTDRAVEAEGVIRSGDAVITNSPRGGSLETRTTVRATNSSGIATGGGNQSVRVTEGMPAYIATGINAPLQSFTVGPDGRRYYQQEYVNAVAGFYATTWLNEGRVRVSIDQSNNQLEGQRIATQQLRSEITGEPGQWIPIGVIDNSASQQNRDIGSRGQSRQATSTQLYIKVETLN